MKDICSIGHITRDKIVTPKNTVYMAGGTSYYMSYGISRLPEKVSYQLVTKVGEGQMGEVEKLRQAGVDTLCYPSRHTVYFENRYGIDTNNRTQRVLAKADPFTAESLKGVEAGVFHLGSLLADDFDLDVIRALKARGVVSVDSQGYLREVRGEKVFAVDWPDKREALKMIDVLKVNEYEMEVLTGQTEAQDAALQLAEWGVNEVCVTLGDYGSVVLENDHFYDICAYPPKQVVDATGCGDTYSTGYLYMRSRGADPSEAGHFAAAMSTLKLEHSGPFARTEEEVFSLIK